jgi:hypothetical protein
MVMSLSGKLAVRAGEGTKNAKRRTPDKRRVILLNITNPLSEHRPVHPMI